MARALRSNAESPTLLSEQHKLASEHRKLVVEQQKRLAEARELSRDRMLAPWQIALSGFVKLIGP